ncbi:hypothetical protein AB4072_15350 [Microvirga sp. 2MCAF38]|uniref:hypothetical protein n=1 Tax=Microvirga sp. 2MCAF38 TaxID=3232989 RepID=UPI003F94591D
METSKPTVRALEPDKRLDVANRPIWPLTKPPQEAIAEDGDETPGALAADVSARASDAGAATLAGAASVGLGLSFLRFGGSGFF